MMQPRWIIPRKLSRECSQRTTSLRNCCSQAKRRSTFQRRRYRRNTLRSCVFRFRLRSCGAIISTPSSANSASNLSESYALSPMSRTMGSATKLSASVRCTSFTSCGEALSAHTATGRPEPSATAMILVPLPRFVLPTPAPPFLPARRSRQ